MKYVILLAVVIGLFVGVWMENIVESVQPISSAEESNYGVMANALIDHENNTCTLTNQYFDVTVTLHYVEDATEIDYYGSWQSEGGIITLNTSGGLDIGVVAHEVAHMVQDEMVGVTDQHFGPYLQQVFTSCVWALVEQDLIEAGALKVFRFAS